MASRHAKGSASALPAAFLDKLLEPLPEGEAEDGRDFLAQIRRDEGEANHRLFLAARAAAAASQAARYYAIWARSYGTDFQKGEASAREVIAEQQAIAPIAAFIRTPSRNHDDFTWKKQVLRAFADMGGGMMGGNREKWEAILAADKAWLDAQTERTRARRKAIRQKREG